MPSSYKVLGQSNPTANTLTTLYTVPAATPAVISTLTVCNLASANATYGIAIRPTGETIANKHYIAYSTTVPGNDTTIITIGMTVSATDVVSVSASTANLVFNAFGAQVT